MGVALKGSGLFNRCGSQEGVALKGSGHFSGCGSQGVHMHVLHRVRGVL